jgi:hypothetical protein
MTLCYIGFSVDIVPNMVSSSDRPHNSVCYADWSDVALEIIGVHWCTVYTHDKAWQSLSTCNVQPELSISSYLSQVVMPSYAFSHATLL